MPSTVAHLGQKSRSPLAKYLIHSTQPLSPTVIERLAARRKRRAGLPFGYSVTRRLRDLSSLTPKLPIPRIMQLDVSTTQAIGDHLTNDDLTDPRNFSTLRRHGALWLTVPLSHRDSSRSKLGHCRFRVGPQRWLATLVIDQDKLKTSDARRWVFEHLATSNHWPIRIESSGENSFVVRRTQKVPTMKTYGKGKKALDPDHLILSGSDDWQSGLEAFRSALQLFEPGAPWQWGFEITPTEGVDESSSAESSPNELWANLKNLKFPIDVADLKLNDTFDSLNTLFSLPKTLGSKDRVVTDLVVLKIGSGYTAEVDLITLSSGHFVEANLKGGWGDEQRRELETLLESEIVDGPLP